MTVQLNQTEQISLLYADKDKDKIKIKKPYLTSLIM